jgi:APA family basic amino acid/polyamine antiporter
VHPRYHVPHRAEVAVGAIALVIVSFGGITGAVSFSAFTVLVYYAIANASAYTLDRHERRWPRWLTVAGLVGCLTLAVNLPWPALAAGAGLFAGGAIAYAVRTKREARQAPATTASVARDRAPSLRGDAQDERSDGEPDDRIGTRDAGRDRDRGDHDAE